MYNNAKKHFFTANKAQTARELLTERMPKQTEPELPITSGGVWLGKYRMTDPNKIIQKGDTLRVYIASTQGKRHTISEPDIIHETNDFCVIYKPPGVSSSPDRSNLFYNLTEGVRAYYASRGNTYQPTPLTRLDYMVQGLCLFAKHKSAEKELFQLTKDRQITKHYIALIPRIEIEKHKHIVDLPLEFTDKARVSESGKSAKTLFVHHQDLSEDVSAYMVKLFTGRRHQIRAHAAKALYPLIGDRMYGSRCKHPEQHIGLIAYKYVFRCFGEVHRIVLPSALDRLDHSSWRCRR